MTVLKTDLFVESELVLAENGDPFSGADKYLPLVSLSLTGKNLQKGGFAGAVCTDQTIAVAGCKLDVDVFKDNPLAIGEGDIYCCNHDLLPWVDNKKTTGWIPVVR